MTDITPERIEIENSVPLNNEVVKPNDMIRSTRFRLERYKYWLCLDDLVKRVEKGGIKSLSYDETTELATNYRQAMNSLSVARDISLDRGLITYLESLCARAYLVVYAPQEGLGGLISRLFVKGIPQAFRRSTLSLVIALIAMALGAAAGFALAYGNIEWYKVIIPSYVADGRGPDASYEYLRSTLYSDLDDGGGYLTTFALYLFGHNSWIAVRVFGLGIFLAIPSFMLVFYNGLILGAFFVPFYEKGLGLDLFAWLSIHGITELAAIVVACAAGTRLGLAVLLPGQRTRNDALRHTAHDAVKLAILSIIMLVVAGFIEGVLRQVVQTIPLRLIIGWGMGVFWLAWLLLSGHKKKPIDKVQK